MTNRAAGLTLLEVMVAMVVGGMALAGAGALMSALADRAAGIDHAAAGVDRDANGERLLRALFANLDLGGDSTTHDFEGDARTMHFHTWCDSALDNLERCSARISIVADGNTQILRLELTGHSTSVMDLRRGLHEAEFRYLITAEQMGTWTASWSQLVVPRAVAVIMDRDTLLIRVLAGG